MLNNFCFHVYLYAQKCQVVKFDPWDMLNNFFSSLCSKVAVYSQKLQCFFLDSLIHTQSCEFRCH